MSKLERGFEYPRKGEDESPRVRSSPHGKKKMEIRVQYICKRKSKKDLKRKWDWKRKGWTDFSFFSKVLIVAN